MSNIENRVSLRDKYKGERASMKGMAQVYKPHVLDVMPIRAKSWEAGTSQHISRCWKSSGILSASDAVDVTETYGKNRGKDFWSVVPHEATNFGRTGRFVY